MPQFIDRTGSRFGRLTIITRASNGSGGRTRWLCRCDCGNELAVISSSLTRGNTVSCGCYHSERTAEENAKRIRHGHARSAGGNKRETSPEYRTWKAMKERCSNPAAPNYRLYGGRGIKVCDRWIGADGFNNFFADMGMRLKGQTIDRINVNADYTPQNCRWASASEQAKNRRATASLVDARKANLARGRKYWPRKNTENTHG